MAGNSSSLSYPDGGAALMSLPSTVREQPNKCLIAVLVGKKVSEPQKLESLLRSAWHLRGDFSISGDANDKFMIHFDCEHDLWFVFKNSPWVVKNTFIVIHQSDAAEKNLFVSPMWVQFKGPPMWYLHQHLYQVAAGLGSIVGDPMFPEEWSIISASCLRVRAKVDTALPLIQRIKFTFGDIHCAYESVYRACKKCGRIGHVVHDCKWNSKAERSKAESMLKKRIRDKGYGDIMFDIKDEKPRDRRNNAKGNTAYIQWRAGKHHVACDYEAFPRARSEVGGPSNTAAYGCLLPVTDVPQPVFEPPHDNVVAEYGIEEEMMQPELTELPIWEWDDQIYSTL